jgi:acyl-CoA synthetase (NDP forming)
MAETIKKVDPSYTHAFLDDAVGALHDWERQYVGHIVQLMEKYDKPVVGVSLLSDSQDVTVRPVDDHQWKAVFYETPEQAVNVMAHMATYQQFRSREAKRLSMVASGD